MDEKQWKASRDVLAAFFEPGWRDPKIEAEIVEAEEKYAKRAGAGREGGLTRAANASKRRGRPSNATSELEANGKPGSGNVQAKSNQSESDPFGSPGRSKKFSTSQVVAPPSPPGAPAPATPWDEHAPFGSDDDGEAAA